MAVQNTSSAGAMALVLLLPNLALFSWDSSSLRAMSVIVIALFQCAQTSVSRATSQERVRRDLWGSRPILSVARWPPWISTISSGRFRATTRSLPPLPTPDVTRPWPVQCGQILLGILLAGTNAVPSRLRGKLSGLLLMVQNVGRGFGQVCSAAALAWSLSRAERSPPLVGHRFVFTVFAVLFGALGALGAANLTEDMMTTVVEDASESRQSG